MKIQELIESSRSSEEVIESLSETSDKEIVDGRGNLTRASMFPLSQGVGFMDKYKNVDIIIPSGVVEKALDKIGFKIMFSPRSNEHWEFSIDGSRSQVHLRSRTGLEYSFSIDMLHNILNR